MTKSTAVILVGGLGTRLRPLTLNTPKPLLPLAGVPFLHHLLAKLNFAGISRVILASSYKAELFTNLAKSSGAYNFEIICVEETKPLGTGGAIRNVLDYVETETVIVCNGDILSAAKIAELIEFHNKQKAQVTLQLVKVANPRAYGCVTTTPDNTVTGFLEKTADPPTNQINAGCYVFATDVLKIIPNHKTVSMEREIFPALLREGYKLVGYLDDSYWRDMGTPEDFVRGSADMVRGVVDRPISDLDKNWSTDFKENKVAKTAQIASSAVLIGGSSVGENCIVGENVVLDGVVLMDNVWVAAHTVIERSIVGNSASIGAKTFIQDAVLGDRVKIGTNCELRNGIRIWPEVVIPAGGIRFSTDV